LSALSIFVVHAPNAPDKSDSSFDVFAIPLLVVSRFTGFDDSLRELGSGLGKRRFAGPWCAIQVGFFAVHRLQWRFRNSELTKNQCRSSMV
jgi:hypothetical protein